MLGKPEWFQRRKYTGWGLTPKTWQGYAYIVLAISVLFMFSVLLPESVKFYAIGFLVLIIVVDCIDMWFHLKLDEREKLHEAISERNAAWYMGLVLSLALVYDLFTNAVKGIFYVNPFMWPHYSVPSQ